MILGLNGFINFTAPWVRRFFFHACGRWSARHGVGRVACGASLCGEGVVMGVRVWEVCLCVGTGLLLWVSVGVQ